MHDSVRVINITFGERGLEPDWPLQNECYYSVVVDYQTFQIFNININYLDLYSATAAAAFKKKYKNTLLPTKNQAKNVLQHYKYSILSNNTGAPTPYNFLQINYFLQNQIKSIMHRKDYPGKDT